MSRRIWTQVEIDEVKRQEKYPEIPIVPPPYDTRFGDEIECYKKDTFKAGVIEWILIILGIGGFILFMLYEVVTISTGINGNKFIILLISILILIFVTSGRKRK